MCFMAMRLDRSMASSIHPSDSVGIDETVSRIGLAGIDAIAGQALTGQALNDLHHHQALALGWLWKHALTTALLARGLALELDYRPAEEAYIAGLLHDIGKMALLARTPAACVPMLADPGQAQPLLEAEEQLIGSDHGRLGERMIQRHTRAWFAADAARYHAASASAMMNALPLVQVVWAAHRMAGGPQASSDALSTVAGLFNRPSGQLRRLWATAEKQAQAVADELGVVPYAAAESGYTGGNDVPLKGEIRTRTIMSGVCGELLKAPGRQGILRILQHSLSAYLGIDSVIILDHDPGNNTLIGSYAAGIGLSLPKSRLRIPLTASGCLPAICHTSGETVDSFSRTRREALTIIDRQLAAYMRKDGIVCVPFPSRHGGSACLLAGVDRDAWPWIKQQAPLLKAIAAAVADTLDKEPARGAEGDRRAPDQLASARLRTRKIVHEINNPLSIIKNYIKVLTLQAEKSLSGENELRIINEEINRVGTLIKSLTATPSADPPHMAPFDLNAAITELLSLFRESLPERPAIRLEQDLGAHLPALASDRNQLKQALINLLKNAMEAMPDGGTIHVKTRMIESPPRHTGGNHGKKQIRISICDDGPGIDEGIKNDLFRENVTSKRGHDGLGLSIVNETVRSLGGALLCDSIPGRGTCFHIELPAGGNGPDNETALSHSGAFHG
ncbi:hypothetical protein DSCA_31770 [Desulfosarcina alkanivorans]|uniref:histidine kinase n=1 Tax=Desulfosarcina alkanivorans TaxID=571177 RepID=A0A5K7YX29_9BACT|nr:hypothetical protein DSCA_31770 [Desulfosarcina alkanivorans]